VRATGLDGIAGRLTGYGEVRLDGDILSIAGIDAERVPELVADLVREGARVHEVQPGHESLEERFLRALEES
jgi:hypothetical protein